VAHHPVPRRHGHRRHPAVFYATIAGKIYVSTRRQRDMEPSLPARISGRGPAPSPPVPSIRNRVCLLAGTTHARAHHLGRGENDRFRRALGPVYDSERRLAIPAASARDGRATVRPGRGAARRQSRLRHRFRPRDAHHGWRQTGTGRTPLPRRMATGPERDRCHTCYGVHFDPSMRATYSSVTPISACGPAIRRAQAGIARRAPACRPNG